LARTSGAARKPRLGIVGELFIVAGEPAQRFLRRWDADLIGHDAKFFGAPAPAFYVVACVSHRTPSTGFHIDTATS